MLVNVDEHLRKQQEEGKVRREYITKSCESKVFERQGGDDDDDDDNEKEMETTSPGGDSGAVGKSEHSDRWVCRGRNLTWVRDHRTSRIYLFRPGEAERGPSNLKRLWNIRKTAGVMEDGRRSEITDDWTRQDEHKVSSLRQSWAGQTTFTMRTPQNKLEGMQIS